MSSSRPGTPHSRPATPHSRPATPRSRPATPGNRPRTPRRARTPRSRVDDEFIIEASDPFSLPLSTSDDRQRPTSPFVGENDNVSSPLNYGTPSSMYGSMRTPRSVVRNTPLKTRPDVPMDKRVRQLNVLSEGDDHSSEADRHEPTLVIWGTDVVVTRCKAKFKEFICNFIGRRFDDSEPELLYIDDLNKISVLDRPFLNVNCAHLERFNIDLYRQLIAYPQEVITSFDMAANELFFQNHPEHVLPHQIQVRPYNTEKTLNMRELNPEDIDKLITVNGMVIRTSYIIPEMGEAFFKCSVCDFSRVVEIDHGRIAEPTLCTNCNTNHCFTLIHNRSEFNDKQMIKLQESPDDMPAGQTPHTVTLYAHNDLVDSITPGQRVSVTGIYRAVPLQSNPRMRNLNSVYRTYIDILHISKIGTKCIRDSNETFKPSPERLELLIELSKRPDLYDRLANSIAPSIFENDDIKKGILLQLFGGTRKTFNSSGRTAFRSEINILLCGDPGTTKSQLLSYVYNLVPRSQYTSGKGSSAVGLTAYVTKDPETRQLVLQTGALVLADNGVCCIDEFDKMNEATRSVLHEVMEQQTLSIAKAGIVCQLNARTSILAAANPLESEWNKNKTIIENIRLPHTLLSRFDLIFLMLDPQSEHYDRKLGRHLVSLYYQSKEKEQDEFMDHLVLKDYITYCRDNLMPSLSAEASEHLVCAYVEMRKVGSGKGQISAYPRQLESLIRLSEAHAKMRMSQTVDLVDVKEAQRLHREALKQSATDPLSGKIDVNILTTGLSIAARKKKQMVVDGIRTIIEKKSGPATLMYRKLFNDLKDILQVVISRDMFDEALKELQEGGLIKVTGKQSVKVLG